MSVLEQQILQMEIFAKQEEQQRQVEALIQNGKIVFSRLPELDEDLRKVLLGWISRAMGWFGTVLRICPLLNMDTVIISGIMPLVPGVAITNAIRDTLRGDYISGGARALEAFVTAAAVAIGVGVGIGLTTVFWQGGGLL